MALTRFEREAKLQRLAQLKGFNSVDEMFDAAVSDTVCPGICCNPANMACDYTSDVAPEQSQGWCKQCHANTVQSCLVLADIL